MVWLPLIDGKRYPIEVEIFVPNADGTYTIRKDKAGRRKSKDSDVEFWQLKFSPKGNNRCPPIPFGMMFRTPKGKQKARLFNPSPGEYHPMAIDRNNLKVIPVDARVWWINERNWKESRYRHKESFWSKYGDVITLMMVGIFLVLIFWAYGDFFNKASLPLQNAAASLQAAADSLSAARGVVVPPP